MMATNLAGEGEGVSASADRWAWLLVLALVGGIVALAVLGAVVLVRGTTVDEGLSIPRGSYASQTHEAAISAQAQPAEGKRR